MESLEKGQPFTLTAHQGGPLYLTVQTSAHVDTDVSVFCTNEHLTLEDEGYFVFYNQQSSPNREVRFLPALSEGQQQIGLSLSKLPEHICNLTCTLTTEAELSGLEEVTLQLHGPDRHAFLTATLPITEAQQALILCELARIGDDWHMVAVGECISGDLNNLFTEFKGGRRSSKGYGTGPAGAQESNPAPTVPGPISTQAMPTPSQIEPKLALPTARLTPQDAEISARLIEVANRIPGVVEQLQTEEATKHTLVMPFIQALGYDVFNPSEVTPELNADMGIKKGEKVDYAILRDGKPIILIESKHHNVTLAFEHASQLYRYFSVTDARFGILTNGIKYRFYTDLEKPNTMDRRPFLEVDLLQLKDTDIAELLKFAKHAFDQENILSLASEMKYVKAIKQHLAQEFTEPSDEMIRMLTARVFDGRLTAAVRDSFALYTKKALNEFLAQIISDRLRDAFTAAEPSPNVNHEPEELESDGSGLITTPEEWQAFYMVRSMLREEINYARLHLRKHQSYSAVLLDNNRRRTICRFYFTEKRLQVGLFHRPDRQEVRVTLDSLDDLFKHSARLLTTVQVLEGK